MRDVPVHFAYAEVHSSFVLARRREAQIKRWSRAKKEALISGNLAQLHAFAIRKNY
jgi:putative endonuclease